MKADPVFAPTQQWVVLLDLVRMHGWARGAEIGVLRGKTLFKLLDNAPGLTLFGVDQWRHLPESTEDGAEHYSKFDMRALAQDVKARALAYGERCRILHGDSVEMAAGIPDGSLDFVFIDAAHTTRAVLADIAAWKPKVRPGGMVTGHDWQWPSVAAALDQALPGWAKLPEQVWTWRVP